MEENTRKYGSQPGKGQAGGKNRHRENDVVEGDGEMIKCSGKTCRSCTGRLIADCVAVCCCPCAVLNLLTLAFVKVPYKMGRKCLGKRRNSNSKNNNDRIRKIKELEWEERGGEVGIGIGNKYGEELELELELEEKVWLELYQVGHLGFGRVSFTGVTTATHSNLDINKAN